MNLNERKIVSMFKAFIERVFVPQLPKMDLSCQQEWNKFSNIISSDQLTLAEIQLYVDTLPATSPSTNRPNFIPNDNPFEANTSLISVNDFLPRFGVFSNSTSVF